ncbi:MAG: hypothetical protein SVX43_14405 [Cyanobacteriota bacterium]|nr:hypothetical protein [Cyanobacteriota bacterium]
MSNTIHQYGQGDNVAGDKVIHDFQGANLSGVIGSQFSDNAQVSDNQFIQNNNADAAELLQLIASLRQTAAQFPEDVREEIIIDIEDVEAEVQKPETERNKTRLKKRLAALLATVLTISGSVAAVADFTNNVTDLGEKLGIELIINNE